jgi:predicted acylesterase/phospholipase RssA
MFGAWQAGAWSVLSRKFQPDLIVGASVGSLNGYLIASGVPPEDLHRYWLELRMSRLRDLQSWLKLMAERYHPRIPFALTVTDVRRLKPRIFQDQDVTWRHLAASCALPLILPQIRIDGRLYSDGGLLNPLPAWAAIELGATRVLGLNVLPEIPSPVLRPVVKTFRRLAGYNPPAPAGVEVKVLQPSRRLGTVRDAVAWRKSNIESWLELGARDAAAAVPG